MDLDVRTITDDEVPRWVVAVSTGFHGSMTEEEGELRRPSIILDRTWAGFDGRQIVSTFRSFPTELTVPGGRSVPVSAITAVTTRSTHRRRGLATRMMTGDLLAARDRGELAAILIAAEYPIYGRFGFGPATEHQTVTVDTRTARLRIPAAGSVEYIDVPQARELAPDLHERARAGQPGDFAYPDRFWDLEFGLLRYPSMGEPKPFFTLLARDVSGIPVGLVTWEYKENWENWLPQSTVTLRKLIAVDDHAAALLWQTLLNLDLVSTVRAELHPVDDVLFWLLVDARHARATTRGDHLWLRPLDTPGFLADRRYPVAGRVVLEVVDPLGLSGGRFALEGDSHGATCRPTTESADLTIGLSQLGAILLGGFRLRRLFGAGLIDEHTAGAVSRADALFAWPETPWCSQMF